MAKGDVRRARQAAELAAWKERERAIHKAGFVVFKNLCAGPNSNYSFRKGDQQSIYAFDSAYEAYIHIENHYLNHPDKQIY